MDYTAIFKGFLQIIASSHLRTKRSGIPSKLSKVEKVMRCTMIWFINPNIPKQSNTRFKLNWRYPTMIMNPAYHHGPRIFFMILNGNIVMDEDCTWFQRPFQKPFCGTSKGRNPPHSTSVLRACSWQMGLEMIGKNDGIEDASLRDAWMVILASDH